MIVAIDPFWNQKRGKRNTWGCVIISCKYLVQKKRKCPFELGLDIDHIGCLLLFSFDCSNPKMSLKGSTDNQLCSVYFPQRGLPLTNLQIHFLISVYTFQIILSFFF